MFRIYKIFIFVSVTFNTYYSVGQELVLSEQQISRIPNLELLDSIKVGTNNEKPEAEYVNSLSLLTDYYRQIEEFDSAYFYFQKLIGATNEERLWSLQVDIVLEFDLLFVMTNNFSQGIVTHDHIISNFGSAVDLEERFFLYSRRGYFNESIGRVKQSVENNFVALHYAEQLNDEKKIAWMCNNIGSAYISIEQPIEAKKYIQKGIDICEKLSEFSIPILYNNLADINESEGDTHQAIKNYKKCLQFSEGNKDAIITSSINLSNIWVVKNVLDSADYFSKLALSTAYSLGPKSQQLVRAQYQASIICEAKHQKECQILFLDSAYSQAKELLLLIELEVISQKLFLFHESRGETALALFYVMENMVYGDSINLQETQTLLLNKKEERNLDNLRFASYKLESEKNLLELEISKRNSVLILTVSLICSLFMIIILSYWNVRRKRKILKLKLQQKEVTINTQNREILSANLEIDAQEQALKTIKTKLTEELSSEYDAEFNELDVVLKQANRSISKLDRRKYVNELIKSTDTNFHKILKQKFPELTKGELKLVTLIRLNLGSEELENIFIISRESLNKKRYRIRKKMKLTKNQELDEFIRQIV